jgi:hypothetical protein
MKFCIRTLVMVQSRVKGIGEMEEEDPLLQFGIVGWLTVVSTTSLGFDRLAA